LQHLFRSRLPGWDARERVPLFQFSPCVACLLSFIYWQQTITKGSSNGFKADIGSGMHEYTESFTRRMLQLFPSGNITFTQNPKNQWTLSYGRRINRPSYKDLNPFELRTSEYWGFKGNPNLVPETAHSIGLIHAFHSKLVTSLTYTITDNVIVSISDTLNGTKSFYFPKNLASQKHASLNVHYSFTYKQLSVTTGATGFYTHNQADFGPGRLVDLSMFAFTSFAQPNFKHGTGWSSYMRVSYESPRLFRGTMRQRAQYSANMGVQKMLFNDRATIRANFNDVFKTLRWHGTSDFAGQYLYATALGEPRRLVVSFMYRFGSNQVKSMRQRKTGIDEESKRTEGSN